MKKYGLGFSVMKKSNTIIVGGVAPSPVGAPSISRIGNSIVCNKGTWIGTEPITYSYVFIRSFDGGVNFEVVQSSNSDTYPLSAGDNLALIRCNVIAQNGISPNGFEASNDLNLGVLIPTFTIAPGASGQPFVSRILTSTNGTWNGTSPINFTYQWQRSIDGGVNYADISGATNNTYTLQSPDSGYKVRCRVRATNAFTFVDSFTNVIDVVLTLLDRYSSNHLVAYHLRLQRGAYFGNNLVEIRRTVDSSLLNIGHDAGGNLDIAAAISHAGNVNRLIWSQDFSQGAWNKINATIISTNNIAPDSTNSATLYESTSAFGGVIQQTEQTSVIPGAAIYNPTGTYCVSLYVKRENNDSIRILDAGFVRVYNFNFASPAANPSVGGNFEILANGWFRIWFTLTGTQLGNGLRVQSNSGTIGARYLVWGFQVNPGTSPIAYTPTNANPSGFARIRTKYDHSANGRHAVASSASREDFIVVDGASISLSGDIIAERYESTHGTLAAGYDLTSIAMGSNSTAYSKSRRYTGRYSPYNGVFEHPTNNVGFSDPTAYNSSLIQTTEYKVNIFNRSIPNGQVFRRLMSDNSWTAGTLLTNLAASNPNLTRINGSDPDNQWGRVAIRGDVIFNTSHDISTMQAISQLM